jgi:undecaprenyl-diphosphatase
MDIVHAIALGLIQGIAELFPISSAAHTLLLSYLFRWPLPSLPFVVMLHLGTFLAVLVYFARDFAALLAGLFSGVTQSFSRGEQRLALLVLTGTLPLALVGKLFERQFDRLFASPLFAAAFLLLTGLILFGVERLREGARQAVRLSWLQAFLIGLSQIGGLFPGGSRSGFSIAAGMLARLSREEAARFSFLLAAPAILGASAFELRRIVHAKAAPDAAALHHGIANASAAPEPAAVIFAGFAVAFVAGWFAIRFFMRYVSDHKLTPFAVYCWLFGLAMIAVIALRSHGAA